MYSVYQHWDPLKVCVVGRSYPPEFYSWIKVSHVRKLFEQIALETEEDYQNIIACLEKFGVIVLRPDLPAQSWINDQFVRPPMTPRDHFVMIGKKFYTPHIEAYDRWSEFYNAVKSSSWPPQADFADLPAWIQTECKDLHGWHADADHQDILLHGCYDQIIQHIKQQCNEIVSAPFHHVNGAMVSRIGRDLYFGTEYYTQDCKVMQEKISKLFPDTRNHIVNTGGHSDGTYCPVTPGLIISLRDVPTYRKTFPEWEVIYLPNQSWAKVKPFLQLKAKNKGRWWIPGFEHDHAVIDVVEQWLGHWTGYVEETVFDVNMLIIDPKNVMVFNHNDRVFEALSRYGITPHVVPFRHRFFWDGGIHCVTLDLDRTGSMQDFFPFRG